MNQNSYKQIVTKIVNIKVFSQPHAWSPPTDLMETDESFLINIEIAGINPDDLTISVFEQIVTVIGKRTMPDKKCAYHRMEIPYGEFRAEINLPAKMDYSNAFAEYQNGFLTISIPKAKEIQVKVNSTKED